jgi:glycosyltransferase involved in cell wall biosynthesis
MRTDDLITVAIPLYNHEEFIEECLNSILSQGISSIELLLLDDGSKDDGYEIACRWEEQNRVHFERTLFKTQTNAGITRTIDQLIQLANGRFILFVASDDVLLPGSIISRLELFEDERVNAVFGDAIPIDENGRVLAESAISNLGVKASRVALSDPRTLLWELVFRWNIYGSVNFFRRNSLLSGCGRSVLDLGLYSEDMQLYYMFAAMNSLRYLDLPVSLYRMHSGSTCRSEANDHLIRKNIYQSRRVALHHITGMLRCIIKLQMITSYRKQCGATKVFLMPIIIGAYGILWAARVFYDLFRLVVLKQKRDEVESRVVSCRGL